MEIIRKMKIDGAQITLDAHEVECMRGIARVFDIMKTRHGGELINEFNQNRRDKMEELIDAISDAIDED